MDDCVVHLVAAILGTCDPVVGFSRSVRLANALVASVAACAEEPIVAGRSIDLRRIGAQSRGGVTDTNYVAGIRSNADNIGAAVIEGRNVDQITRWIAGQRQGDTEIGLAIEARAT
jgi:sulfate adenylyltransferase subunit 1 (EFTu-like GTPase family)